MYFNQSLFSKALISVLNFNTHLAYMQVLLWIEKNMGAARTVLPIVFRACHYQDKILYYLGNGFYFQKYLSQDQFLESWCLNYGD